MDTQTIYTGESSVAQFDQQTFLRKTYGHLFGAVIAFIALEYVLFTSGIALRL
jgi:hypothetical protein